mgnify:CR=1 FL=1
MKKKVLVIEQNHSIGFVIKTVLSEAFKAIVTTNPFDAMDVLSQNNDILCIVLGIDKRSSQSHSFLQHLKSSSLLKNIPLIALTDIDEDTFREMYGENEISGVFKKPFDPLKVKQSIENLCHPVDTTQIVFRKRGILNLN